MNATNRPMLKEEGMTTRPPRTLALATALIALVAAFTVRCKDSNTITGARSLQPTPIPNANLAGAWSGTYSTTSRGFTNCTDITITATFVQTGAHATATIESNRSGCGVPTSLDGTVSGNAWTGTAAGFFNLDSASALASGSLSEGTALTLRLQAIGYLARIELHQ